jgi:hypothetical protein
MKRQASRRTAVITLLLGASLVLGVPITLADPPPPTPGRVGPRSPTDEPKPLITSAYLDVDLRFDRGRLVQRTLVQRRFPRPTLIKRFVGRFVARMYTGKTLRDALTFNLPLLAPAENYTRAGARIAARLEANLVTSGRVRLPWEEGIDRIEITDLATGRRWLLDLAPLRRPAVPVPRR